MLESGSRPGVVEEVKIGSEKVQNEMNRDLENNETFKGEEKEALNDKENKNESVGKDVKDEEKKDGNGCCCHCCPCKCKCSCSII